MCWQICIFSRFGRRWILSMWINRRTVKSEEAYSLLEQEPQTAARKLPFFICAPCGCDVLYIRCKQPKWRRKKCDYKCKRDENMETRCWLKAGGPCGYYYSEGCEYQRATSKGLPAYRDWRHGGKKELNGGFPRQKQQLPTRPPSQHVSSVCSLSSLRDTQYRSQRLTEDTALES